MLCELLVREANSRGIWRVLKDTLRGKAVARSEPVVCFVGAPRRMLPNWNAITPW